jgi:molybdate transport system ATP-binding protein
MPEAGLRARVRMNAGSFLVDVELDGGAGVLVVVGPNGAGKTTLLEGILGLREVQEAAVRCGGETLVDTARGLVPSPEVRRFGYVPQGGGLFPHMTVREQLVFAARLRGRRAGEATAEVDRTVLGFGLASLADRRPAALSGGERQRAALARAVVGGPRALLLDEPMAALDVVQRKAVRESLAVLLRERKVPAIVVTHDADDARTLADRVAVLERGVVVQVGTWADLVARPATSYVAGLIASRP